MMTPVAIGIFLLAILAGFILDGMRTRAKNKARSRYPSPTAKRIAPVVPLDECENKISE